MKPKLFSTLGPIFWISSLQYYAAQVFVAAYWPSHHGYSWANDTISALGNTDCGLRAGSYVCSPLHTVMNVSFLALGLTTLFGAVLIKKHYAETNIQQLGFYSMAIAGVGTIFVALFPENSVSILHILGAGLAFFFGNVSMVVLGISLKNIAWTLRYFSVALGVLGLASLCLFMTSVYAGLGIGGMERLVAYPQSIWMISFGLYILVKEANYEKK